MKAENSSVSVDASETENVKSTNRILIISLIIASFFLGSLTNKLSSLEKNGSPATNANIQQTVVGLRDTFLTYAKEAGLDEKKFSVCFDEGRYKQNVSNDLSQAEKVGVSGTPAFFINGKFLGGAFPIEAFKEIIDKELNGTGSTNYKDYSKTLQDAYENTRGKLFDPEPKTVDIEDAPIRGSSNAKVIIVEFSDFQCPFCKRTFPTIQQLMKDYDGKVQFAYKHFPLTQIHPNAQKSAEASECANEQAKFWEYHDILFKNQAAWSELAPITN